LNAEIITIEEWAGDNGIKLTDTQIKDLTEAINVCCEVPLVYFNEPSNYNNEVEKLKYKIILLESFIREKGFNITVNDDYIKEHCFERITDCHIASNSRIFRL